MALFMRFSDRLHACLSVALVLLFAIGCGGGTTPAPGSTPDGTPPTSQQTPSTDGTDPAVNTAQPPEGNAGETFLAWIVGLGPGSPEGPTQVDLYQLIMQATQDSCRQALDPELNDAPTRTLYQGAAAACLAALHGKNARWAEAEAAFSSLHGRPAGCVDQATFDLLGSILEAHDADPEAVFTREGEPVEGKPDRVRLPCPRVTKVTVTRGSGVLEINVEGTRLNQVLELSYAPVDQCPQPPDFESGLRLEPEGDSKSLHATVTGSDEALAAAWLWVGAIAEPYDWVAAADCVPIRET